MKVKFLGENCFLISYKGKTILTDPFYNYQKEKSGFNIEKQSIDYVLITHAHGDHTADVKEVLQFNPEAVIIAQPEVCAYFGAGAVFEEKIGNENFILSRVFFTICHFKSLV